VVRALLEDGARVTVYDPVVPAGTMLQLFGPAQVRVAASMADAVADAQVVILVTRWAEFLGLPGLLADRSDPPLVVDGRRLLDPSTILRYEGVGR
jgi:UDPglucose 6-dehydrogenase/GDP-mannose 6-dehydrogenase